MNRRRQATNQIARATVYITALLALVPLGLVLWYTVTRGLPVVEHSTFFTCCKVEHPPGIPGGGVANAIAGTAIMVGIASLLAIPAGVVRGVGLAEYGHRRLAGWIRLACDVLVETLRRSQWGSSATPSSWLPSITSRRSPPRWRWRC